MNNRENCQREILKRLKQIEKVYAKYYPNGEYLEMTILDGSISFRNSYSGDDRNFPLNVWNETDLTKR